MKNLKSVFVPSFITIVFGLINYYFFLPAISFKSIGLWFYIVVLLVIYTAFSALYGFANLKKFGISTKAGLIGVGITILIVIISSISSSRLVNSREYANILKEHVKESDFNTYKATLDNVPLLDKDSAVQLSNRKLGSLIDVVSQFELGENEQITLNGKSVRVSPLYYGSFFKWNNNKNTGTPGYIKIDMITQEAELVRTEKGIKYSPSEFFGRDLKRYLRIKYPAAIFNSFNFEISEEGTPFWIVPIESHTIGLFGGVDIHNVLIVNAITGNVDEFAVEEAPEWIDNVYNSDLVISQYDDFGSLQSGYWNSVFGQKGVKVTTDGYNYIPQDNDNWIYTGVTSTGRDESNIGFILSNKRTKETLYYPISGAEEYSAMSSAEGVVQHLGYIATFPLLLKIEGQPTYMMALKDAGGLVKMYGMVNVEKYQVVATGETINSTKQRYRELLKNNSIEVSETVTERVTGVIENIKTASIDGTTYYYIKLNANETYFLLNIKDNQLIVLKEIGTTVSLDVDKNSIGKIRNAVLVE